MAAAGEEEEERTGGEDWGLPSEVEVLESIYLDELHVFKGNRSIPWEISITLHPATAEDQDSQYVCFTLVLSVPLQYPNEIPKIAIQNPRGLSDEQIQKISQTLQGIAESQLGTPVLYELIEKGKEILTDNNIPHGQCVICLYGFQENEAFTKTTCYHYFHSRCLASYIEYMEKEINAQKKERMQHLTTVSREDIEVQCPVCREPLAYDLATLQAAPLPQQLMEIYQPDQQTLQHREQLRQHFQRQQEKGGIIDVELERNRYFVTLQRPSDVREYDHIAILENDLGTKNELKSPAISEHTQSTTPMSDEVKNTDTSSVSLHHHNRRERNRGEKSSLQNPSWQLHYKTLEMATGKYVEEEPEALSRRSNWKKERGRWNYGRYNQDISKSYSHNQEPSFLDKKDLCAKDLPSAKEEKNNMDKWIPMPKTQASNREKVDICHSELRGQNTWQGQHGIQNCERWEKTKGREYVTYPRMPRGRGQSRPKPRKELQGPETEGSS
ncbi:E3 ubiquitin-protein ligase RNF25 [Pantherophis guttatus]|uniref:E3 ubiquitin-protein ligase RNF25 n=1 Tax=Pantherophis guttatus TaxID=94885 RepID=A0A6P9D1F6_PANGU|nr:E3 ubiquitin-protein ligase RNF25 [Pantherophis guttatus]